MQLIGKKKSRVDKYWKFWLDCLFPKQCFVCQKEGEYLCSACFDKVELTKNKCYLCQQETSQLGICSLCQERSYIDGIIVATVYADNVAGQLVEALKYNYIEELALILANLIQKRVVRDGFTSIVTQQILVPIPLHQKRFLERGFNQSELLAKELACLFGGQVEVGLLKRVRYTNQQAKLTRVERLDNMKEAFAVNTTLRNISEVILVDDVITTGSTISEAAQALKQAGVNKVIAMAVCHG